MRKGATRGLINKTFIEHAGTCKIFDREKNKTKKHNFLLYVDKHTERYNNVEDLIQKTLPRGVLLLTVEKHVASEKVFSMSKEDFIKHATIF